MKTDMKGIWCILYMDRAPFLDKVRKAIMPFFPEAVANILSNSLIDNLPFFHNAIVWSMRADDLGKAMSWKDKVPDSSFKKRIIEILYDESDENKTIK